jgi:hypothetical protein
MDHNQIVKSLMFIRPNAEFILNNDGLNWLDKIQAKPTEKEIKDGWAAYEAAERSKAETKLQTKLAAQAKLAALGLTVEDLTALGL